MNGAISSPKLGLKQEVGAASWYKYYAGYSSHFVSDILKHFTVEGQTVLDPWNGAGTTTYVSNLLDRSSIGVDINPALVCVAKAKLLEPNVSASLLPLASKITKASMDYQDPALPDDGLFHWFEGGAVKCLRAIELSILRHLVDEDLSFDQMMKSPCKGAVTPLSGFFYVALFRAVRSLISPFKTSNPTWIKVAKKPEDRLRVSAENIVLEFKKEVFEMAGSLDGLQGGIERQCITDIRVGNSKHLDIRNGVVDFVLTSPPYCTRINYVRATLPELCVALKNDPLKDEELQAHTIGATTNRKGIAADESFFESVGGTCEDTINSIARHPSKASSTYYYEYFVNYFKGLVASMSETERVLAPGGKAAFVVQDSFYKDVHIDLPKIVMEIGEGMILKAENLYSHLDNAPFSLIHKHGKKYRDASKATESVILLEKSS
ncbi:MULTISPECIES: DNA methyltransferase [Halomonadaceae]|uniref:DNA methyltransferase n=1 Tax=Halomonadaceae TaxID=28256 RepID=UPI0015838EEF|nr:MULTISPECIES: DNA methyltransferase [Halomonas]MDI4636718.1 site-specific DNA-methyltransferase [Halomonas sp. BMC7]NUJ61083.1 hypothetical protein [Halomonas taeanensis]